MGGSGSGHRWDSKSATSDYLRLDIRRLVKRRFFNELNKTRHARAWIAQLAHSQTTSVCHPKSFSCSRATPSRAVFRSNFGPQYSCLLSGTPPSAQPGCWCQKQP